MAERLNTGVAQKLNEEWDEAQDRYRKFEASLRTQDRVDALNRLLHAHPLELLGDEFLFKLAATLAGFKLIQIETEQRMAETPGAVQCDA